jgi:hypothetical protein
MLILISATGFQDLVQALLVAEFAEDIQKWTITENCHVKSYVVAYQRHYMDLSEWSPQEENFEAIKLLDPDMSLPLTEQVQPEIDYRQVAAHHPQYHHAFISVEPEDELLNTTHQFWTFWRTVQNVKVSTFQRMLVLGAADTLAEMTPEQIESSLRTIAGEQQDPQQGWPRSAATQAIIATNPDHCTEFPLRKIWADPEWTLAKIAHITGRPVSRPQIFNYYAYLKQWATQIEAGFPWLQGQELTEVKASVDLLHAKLF